MHRLLCLGQLSLVDSAGQPVSNAAAQPRRLALLALLGRSAPRAVSRDRLIGWFWPEADEERGRRSLNQALYALRSELGSEEVLLGQRDVRLNLDLVSCDVADFEAAMESGQMETAASLYRGLFIDGFHLSGAPEFQRWVDEERRALAHRYAEAVEALATSAEDRADHQTAVGWWRKAASVDPASSRLAIRLMRALDGMGDRTGAIRHATIYETIVQQQLELPADPGVMAFAEELKTSVSSGPRSAARQSASPGSRESSRPGALPRTSPVRSVSQSAQPVMVSPPSLGAPAAAPAAGPRSDRSTELLPRLRAALGEQYAVEREVGRGGMARVFLASQQHPQRRVAIKVLDPAISREVVGERFVREIDLGWLTHPHILPIFAAGEADGLLYYVMPYVEGESLGERLARDGKLQLDDVIRIAGEVADALSYAHAQGVIHRAIKPGNILLEAGHAVVADFGVARALTPAGRDTLTEAGFRVGTPSYMSPEQAGGGEVDARTDIYALGCVVHEMLVGAPPSARSMVPPALFRGGHHKARSLRAARPRIPVHIVRAVERAVALEAVDRFGSATEFARALRGEQPARPHSTTGLWRHGAGKYVAAAALPILLGALGITAYLATRPDAPPDNSSPIVAVLPLENSTGDSTFNLVGAMVTDWVTQSLAETGLVRVMDTRTLLTSRDDVHQLARQTGATYLVTGNLYRTGDSLEFRTRITAAHDGRIATSIDPLRTSVGEPTEALQSLEERVTGALAVLVDRRLSNYTATASRPPTWVAYQEFLLGMRDFGTQKDYEANFAHFSRAAQLDTTYWQARLWAGISLANARHYPQADSVFQTLVSRRDQMAPYDRASLDYFHGGFVRGDWETSRSGAQRMAELAPLAGHALWALGLTSRMTGRLEAAIKAFSRIELNYGWGAEWADRVLGETARTYHMLGRHGDEREATRRMLERVPNDGWAQTLDAVALAADLRYNDLARRVETAMTLGENPRTWEAYSAGDLLVQVARELTAHGAPADTVRRYAEAAVQWYAAPTSAGVADTLHLLGHARASYTAGHWAEAQELYERLVGISPGSPEFVGGAGAAAARTGDTARAEAALKTIAAMELPYPFGRRSRFSASVAAALGRRDDAIRFLAQSRREGLARWYD